MTAAARTKAGRTFMTTAEYLALPSGGRYTELIYGEIVMSPTPAFGHQVLVYCLVDLLTRWTRRNQLGSVTFHLDMVLDIRKALVRAPDIVFLAAANEGRLRRGRIYGPADLCVEVLSPSDRPILQKRRFADYERYGVPWYWIVRPGGTSPSIEEYELVDGKYHCRSEISGDAWFTPGLFPGLTFRLPPMIAGEDLKTAVKGKARKLV
jgi:Uma2 family endonuclease